MIYFGEKGLKKSWQDKFPKSVDCINCKGADSAGIGFVYFESGREKNHLCSMNINRGKGKLWFHDCVAVAVYFCRECLEATALCNQA